MASSSSPLHLPLLTLLIAAILSHSAVLVDARQHIPTPDDANNTTIGSPASFGCCSRDYKTCASSGTKENWFCNAVDPVTYEPLHCGSAGGCLDMVWLRGNVFDFQCVGYRGGACSPDHSEWACCQVDGLEHKQQLKCDSVTLTCLLPQEIAGRSIQHVVPSTELNTPGWDPYSENKASATGCCSHDHKSCDTRGYCNWKERCGRFDVSEQGMVMVTQEITTENVTVDEEKETTNDNNNRRFKDDHCRDYIWLDDLGKAYAKGDASTTKIRNNALGNSLEPFHPDEEGYQCLGREAGACKGDAECCPGLVCQKPGAGVGYSHCAWDAREAMSF